MIDNKKNECIEQNDEFSEKLFLAMSDIDDSLIEEAAPAFTKGEEISSDEKVVKLTGADLIRSNPNFKRYLLAVACFAIVAVLSVPLISSLNTKNSMEDMSLYSNAGSESCEEAKDDVADSLSTTKVESNIDKNSSNRYDLADQSSYGSNSSSSDISYFVDDFKADYGYKLIVNTYTGNDLDDKAADPQGILSQMKTTTAPNGFRINDFGDDTDIVLSDVQATFDSVYIVAISNETVGKIMRVYDPETLELLLEKPGSSVADICGEIGIAG